MSLGGESCNATDTMGGLVSMTFITLIIDLCKCGKDLLITSLF